jgi:hypothetical protein
MSLTPTIGSSTDCEKRARPAGAFGSVASRRPRSNRRQELGDVNSRDFDSALSEGGKVVRGSGDSNAAESESESQLRRCLLRATVSNARLSALALATSRRTSRTACSSPSSGLRSHRPERTILALGLAVIELLVYKLGGPHRVGMASEAQNSSS